MPEAKKKNIFEKLQMIQAELNAPKNRYNKFGKFYYRSCEDILEAIKPLLKKAGVSVHVEDDIEEIGGKTYVKAIVRLVDLDNPDIQLSVKAFAREAESKSGMDAAQITGTSSSYARKYALNGLFLIDDVKDPDTDEYHNETEQKTTKISAKTDTKALDDFINAGQIETLNMLLSKANITDAKFCEVYGIAVVSELPSAKYDTAVKKLEAAIKAKKEDK